MASFHVRSVSLPKTSHPLTLAVEEQLCQLKTIEQATLSSSICKNLSGLKNLYECVEDFLSTQDRECLDSGLDGSIVLLDVCSITKDVLSQMRQSVQELQSSIRRRSNEVSEYMVSRKKITKVIRKCLADLKNNKKNESEVSMLTEVEATTLAVFESLLSFVSLPKENKSLISKLMPTKKIAHEEETSEVMKVDSAVKALTKGIEVNNVQKTLEALEMTLEDLEDGVESVSRCLIKNRVSLLNIRSHLPKTSHPLTLAVEEQLCQLKTNEQAISSSAICKNHGRSQGSATGKNLSGRKDLYECVEDFLSTQDGECLNSSLDGSIVVLDVCSITKDVLSQMRQSVQELQSSIRRRSNEVSEYMVSRNKISKVVRKCIADIKNNKKNETEVSMLTKVEATTLAVFESLLSFVSLPKENKSLISKLMPTKKVSHEETSEVMTVDIAVKALTKGIEVNIIQKTLKALEMTLEDLEDGVESISRCLIKNRVSLLNILSQ
ncbi:hypothetical protein MKW94_014065 [Papaver nudicaule]|uniref:Uncharacterized protein n=1 Tax=Papaver nudicaule TaxID=74823 RepID=A0AA41UY45_PAPNU|nr:hypothetical protein [Papaver nudicaule]